LRARLLVALGAIQSVVYLLFGFENFEAWSRVPIALWVAAPLVLAYWFGVRISRSRAGFAIVLIAMALALAASVWAYWEITWGETARQESLAGLLFLFGPLYQYALLAVALFVAWVLGFRSRRS
jgi:K+-transporting ATPase A subunit